MPETSLSTAETYNVRPLIRDEVAPGRERAIGAILVDAGRLSAEDAERILRQQKERGLRFGDAAIALRILKTEDIQFALSRQFDYPYLIPGESSVSREVIAAYEPFGSHVEGLRALRSQLMLRWFTGAPRRKALAIASAQRGEGRSYLAANLAVVFSQLGERTLLIDADLRNPRQHEIFGVNQKAGLSGLLCGRGDGDAVERIPAFVDLSVLTAGAMPPNPLELLGRSAFASLLDSLADAYDVIIVDTPAAASGADVQTISARAGAALLLARNNRTALADIQDLSAALTDASATVVGSVLNRF